MKILVVQDYLRSGGTERQSLLLAHAFAAADHATTLLTFRPGGALSTTVPPAIARITLQPFDCGLDWFAPGLLRTAHTHAFDVILCMGRMANCYAGGLQNRLAATAVVGTMRTGKRLPALFRRSLRSVRHIVANSHDARTTLIAHLERARRIPRSSESAACPFSHPERARLNAIQFDAYGIDDRFLELAAALICNLLHLYSLRIQKQVLLAKHKQPACLVMCHDTVSLGRLDPLCQKDLQGGSSLHTFEQITTTCTQIFRHYTGKRCRCGSRVPCLHRSLCQRDLLVTPFLELLPDLQQILSVSTKLDRSAHQRQ